ncbi:hypothetical protein JCM10213_004948 [Rhodosporidiobolus nylandii]
MAKGKRDRHKYRPLPSLYASLPAPPPISSHFDPKPASAAERSALNDLSDLVTRGGAGQFLHSVLKDAHRREVRRRSYSAASEVDTDAEEREQDERELRVKGFVHKKRRKRGSDTDGATTGLEGDDERGSETDGGKKRKRGAAWRSAREDAKRRREMLKIPEVQVDEADLPSNFPSSGLLHSVHSHIASLMTSHHSLLPPLTPSSPNLPPDLRAHFDALADHHNAEEERLARTGSSKQWAAMKRTRIGKLGGGVRHGAWTDAGKAFEGSALLAMGMLAQLLVEDAVRGPPPPPAVPDEPPLAAVRSDELPVLPVAGSSA